MKKIKNCPTQEQINYFYEQVKLYQVMLNLQDWRIESGTRAASKGNMAEVSISLPDKLAIICLGKNLGVPVTDEVLAGTALHELLHVFLKPLIEASKSRDDSAIESAEHSIVVLLEKLLHE